MRNRYFLFLHLSFCVAIMSLIQNQQYKIAIAISITFAWPLVLSLICGYIEIYSNARRQQNDGRKQEYSFNKFKGGSEGI